jgi:hypothetical protein
MAAPTPSEFQAEFPEFGLLPEGAVQAKLDAAYRRVGDSWGDLRDDGAKLLAAHLLAISPLGEPSARSVKAAGTSARTVYLEEWERMLKEVRVWGTTVTVPGALPAGD